ncbi:heat shock transcription factor, Y-linked-like [Gracilinanus agilis]|uniref:heat shock transcription factor, Y-linked-like n=1 Tax=Gracilinanus agilis TaxID=191870 RepID=UPI001CFCE6FA|nr:heat shock transcription factor, Y-linked-like [Gracilinanus agilis]
MESSNSEPPDASPPRGGPVDAESPNNATVSFVPQEQGEIPNMDDELRALVEENAFRALIGVPLAKRSYFPLPNESVAVEENEFFSLTFPRKLWKIVESDRFKSVWWNEDGSCIIIDEKQFREEILDKKGPCRIFETDCMKSFIRQLNLYGFSKLRHDLERSASLDDFLVEEKEAGPSSKVTVHCPSGPPWPSHGQRNFMFISR